MKDYNLATVTHVLIHGEKHPVLKRIGGSMVLIVLPNGMISLPAGLHKQARPWRAGFKVKGVLPYGELVALYVHGVPLVREAPAAK